ncbi:hypothetical protein RBE51_18340 [Pseudomonas taiwanensis]|uniref:hypothetical protein n=1 Tax=Pseudomonas taiwanensis TaxID=470150 RepID=UPI0028DDF970|nr:hypothetical protein [Pseudomonas taiwanensis]MDT8924756.1 hypothetical protein [Pseudomonas taiwanensis]
MSKNRLQPPSNHVLNFRDVTKDQNPFFLTDDDLTASALVIGGSFHDRASLVIAPILDRLMQLGHSGLLLDSSQASVSRLVGRHKQKLVFIGASDHVHPVNLLEAISPEGLRSMLGGVTGMEGPGGVNDAMLVYGYLKESMRVAPTLADLYEALANPSQIVTAIDRYLQHQAVTLPGFMATELAINLADPQGLLNVQGSSFSNGTVRAPVNRLLPILNALRPFWMDNRIRNKLCAAGKTLPLKQLVVDRQKTICLDMPSTVFGDASRLVAQALSEAFRQMVAGLPPAEHTAAPGGSSWKSFFVADEGAEYLRREDLVWCAGSPSGAAVNVVGSSSLSALHHKLGESQSKALLGQIRTKIVLPTDDEASLALVRTHELEPQRLLDQASVATCFVHKAAYPAINGEFNLEPSELSTVAIPSLYAAIDTRWVNERFKAASQAWYVIGPQDEIATKAFLQEVHSRLPKGVQNPELLLSCVKTLPLAGPPGLESLRLALTKAFSGTMDIRHLVFAAGAKDSAFCNALNSPELVKTVQALLEDDHLAGLHLAISHPQANLLLQDSASKKATIAELASQVALAITHGAAQ